MEELRKKMKFRNQGREGPEVELLKGFGRANSDSIKFEVSILYCNGTPLPFLTSY